MSSVGHARDAYLAENGWTLAQYDEPVTHATFFGVLDLDVPNTPAHRHAIKRHDLHHVVTGYGTDMVGEAEISIWELRSGLRGLDLYVSVIVISGALFGWLLSPRRMWRAWRRAKGGTNLFAHQDYDVLLALDVATLRGRLGVASQGACDGERRLHARAPRVR